MKLRDFAAEYGMVPATVWRLDSGISSARLLNDHAFLMTLILSGETAAAIPEGFKPQAPNHNTAAGEHFSIDIIDCDQ